MRWLTGERVTGGFEVVGAVELVAYNEVRYLDPLIGLTL